MRETASANHRCQNHIGQRKQFIRVVRKFTEMQELTPEIVATLIERVEVGQAQVIDGVKKQEIKITYNFIGNIQE